MAATSQTKNPEEYIALCESLIHEKYAAARKAYADANNLDIKAMNELGHLVPSTKFFDPTQPHKVFLDDNPFIRWVPENMNEYLLPTSYRDDSMFKNSTFVGEKLLGAGLEFHSKLSLVHALIFKFLLARSFRVESAADRFLNMRTLCIENNLVWNMDDPDVQKGLSLGMFHFVPKIEAEENRPCVALLMRKLDWEKVTVPMMKKTWFFCVMTVCTWTPVSQTSGVIIFNNMKDVGLAQVKIEFQRWVAGAVQGCVPMRIHAAYIANEPWLVGNIMFPVFKQLLSEKLRSRLHAIGSDYSKLAALPKGCIPDEMGGKRVLDSNEVRAELLVEYDYRTYLQKKKDK